MAEAGFPRRAIITKPMVQKILSRNDLKPFKIKYYCEKRDLDFEQTMYDVLLVYKQVSLQFNENGDIVIPENGLMFIPSPVDEKFGIQAIATTSAEFRPTTETGCVYRDAEYKRLGTPFLLARIDLLTGIAIQVVSEIHKSSDFILLLKSLTKCIQRVTLYA